MYVFSPTTLALMKGAGWSEERRIDVTQYKALLESEGYPVLDIAMEFLSRFGELRIACPDPNDATKIKCVHFCIRDVLKHLIKLNLEDDMRDIASPLTPIGDAYGNIMPIVMDSTGKTYLSFDGLFDLGNSGEEAIETLCSYKPIEGL